MARPPPFYPFHPIWEGASIPLQDWHFHRRLLEHYGIVLRPGEYAKIFNEAVVKKKRCYCNAGKNRVHIAYVVGPQESVFVLANDETLITVLTPIHAERKRKKAERANLAAVNSPAKETAVEALGVADQRVGPGEPVQQNGRHRLAR